MKKIYSIVILVIFMLKVTSVFSQITKLDNIATGSLEYVGWDNTGTSKPLDIMNNSSTPDNIDFYIGGIKYLQLLTSGDLNVVRPQDCYAINNSRVLASPDGSSIFVGVAGGTDLESGNALIGSALLPDVYLLSLPGL